MIDKKDKPVIIDFVGRAGAGKTYVKNQFFRRLSSDYRCLDLSDTDLTIRDYCNFIISAPSAFLASLSLIFFNIPRSYLSMLKLFRKWFACQIKIRKASTLNYDFVTNDEGLFIWWGWLTDLTLRKITFERLSDRMKRSFFYPDITVFVTADFSLSEFRRKRRDLDKRSVESKKKEERIFKGLKIIKKNLLAAEEMEVTKVIYYNNDMDSGVSLVDKIFQVVNFNNSKTKVSIVIPLYNKVDYIDRAVKSVLAQTYQNFEVIVVNDGSTDGSEKVVAQFADKRITLFNNLTPSGETAARNYGIKQASTELIAFLDADDEWMPQFLKTIVRLHRKYPEAGAYATAYIEKKTDGRFKKPIFWFIPRGKDWEGILPDYFRSSLYGASPVWSGAVAIPKRIFDDSGFFAEGVKRGGDLDMWARIALKYSIVFSQYVGAVYHKDVQGSSVKRYKCIYGYKIVDSLNEALNRDNLPASKVKYIKEYANKFILGSAAQSIRAGEISLAKMHLHRCHTKRFFLRKYFLHLYILSSKLLGRPSERKQEIARWYADKGDQTHRLFYEGIDENSIVFDVGGYEGNWSSNIYSMYRCKIHIFEPVPFYADKIEKRFARNPDIFVHKFGLSNVSGTLKINVDKDKSSLFKKNGGRSIKVEIISISDFLTDNKISSIDLLKINIEGAEYDLLESLLEKDLIKNIKNIQIQFHSFVENADSRMISIQKKLSLTHELTYQYKYVWENWKRIEQN